MKCTVIFYKLINEINNYKKHLFMKIKEKVESDKQPYIIHSMSLFLWETRNDALFYY